MRSAAPTRNRSASYGKPRFWLPSPNDSSVAQGLAPASVSWISGPGVGDVAMLAATLVGPSGEVVGVERDERSIDRARTRVALAGLHNVTFTQSDVSQIASGKPFDAVVGRFILMFLPDPPTVLRSLSQLLRPSGVVAFHELSWAPFLLLAARL